MQIVQSYSSVSRIFRVWVYAMELHTRRAQLAVSAPAGGHALIVSPPTDPAIPLIARWNRSGKTTLLCFSEGLEQMAHRQAEKWASPSLDTEVVPFFEIPLADSTVRSIFANCFFDFCSAKDLQAVFHELSRVLEPRGVLHAAYMAPAKSRANRIWERAFEAFPRISCGCHPVAIGPYLENAAFRVLEDEAMDRFGFPVRYTLAQRKANVV